ncbi:hypothetical protein B0A55_00739 [Friedmanniomyces simplex]|uniref:Transcription factor CBF/NF-Y/archaeal histone domain-containing protein n=1 Tax=Friedmanniomyces simplex TaxID=329884 RepID=A0A4U0XXH3_9PEZI|nr:hypothetical protein B0A55_00739 [Friedmanniomyces simplex]
MEYRPQSPDLSSYAPQSPDLSALQPRSPDPRLQQQHYQHNRFGGAFSGGSGFAGAALSYPTSAPPPEQHYDYNTLQPGMASYGVKSEADHDYLPDAPSARGARKGAMQTARGSLSNGNGQQANTDPTLGVTLKTSFPVARIKRIMQADEDIGKVAQVTPHVVSRALELFMIKLISASAEQARGNQVSAQGGSIGGKGPKKVLAQHMKRAIITNDTFDFLTEIANKVPDASAKPAGKVKEGSDSEEMKEVKPRKKASKKRKDSGDDF